MIDNITNDHCFQCNRWRSTIKAWSHDPAWKELLRHERDDKDLPKFSKWRKEKGNNGQQAVYVWHKGCISKMKTNKTHQYTTCLRYTNARKYTDGVGAGMENFYLWPHILYFTGVGREPSCGGLRLDCGIFGGSYTVSSVSRYCSRGQKIEQQNNAPRHKKTVKLQVIWVQWKKGLEKVQAYWKIYQTEERYSIQGLAGHSGSHWVSQTCLHWCSSDAVVNYWFGVFGCVCLTNFLFGFK